MPFEFLVSLKDQLLALARDHQELIVPLVFVLGFAESIALVSLFVPATILFLGIGVIHHAAGGAFVPVWLAGALGAFLGDFVSYAVGRRYRDTIQTVWPFRQYPDLIGRAKAMDEKWGAAALIGSKFLGMLRPFAPVMAGTLPMPWPRFALASAAGALVWAGVFLAPSYGLTFFK